MKRPIVAKRILLEVPPETDLSNFKVVKFIDLYLCNNQPSPVKADVISVTNKRKRSHP